MWGGSEPELSHVLPDVPSFMRGEEKAFEYWADKLGIVARPAPSPMDLIVMGWGSHKERTIRTSVLLSLRERLWEPRNEKESPLGDKLDVLPHERVNAFGVPSPLALWKENPSLLSVEPDGLLVIPREGRELPPVKIVLEIKCPNPFDRREVRGDDTKCTLQMPRVYPSPKIYYLLQIMCECRAYDTPHVLFVCGTPLECRAWFYTFSDQDLRLLDEWLPMYSEMRESAQQFASKETSSSDPHHEAWQKFLEDREFSLTTVMKRYRPWGTIQHFWKQLNRIHKEMCHESNVVMNLNAEDDPSFFVPHCGVSEASHIIRRDKD